MGEINELKVLLEESFVKAKTSIEMVDLEVSELLDAMRDGVGFQDSKNLINRFWTKRQSREEKLLRISSTNLFGNKRIITNSDLEGVDVLDTFAELGYVTNYLDLVKQSLNKIIEENKTILKDEELNEYVKNIFLFSSLTKSLLSGESVSNDIINTILNNETISLVDLVNQYCDDNGDHVLAETPAGSATLALDEMFRLTISPNWLSLVSPNLRRVTVETKLVNILVKHVCC